jgi:hypothetical protein
LESSAGLWGASYMVLERNVQPELAAKWISFFYYISQLNKHIY